jgi:hypothetical protein
MYRCDWRFNHSRENGTAWFSRALKACPERSEGRRLGQYASAEWLDASFRTRVVAEPAL